MNDLQYERIVTDAQNELLVMGETAKIYNDVLVLLRPDQVPLADDDLGMSFMDRSHDPRSRMAAQE